MRIALTSLTRRGRPGLGLVTALLLAACTPGTADDSGVQVVTSFYPLEEAAARLTRGTEAEVVNLTPPGVEPHDLELTPSDVERIQSADLVLYLGGGFQPAVEDALSGAEGRAVDLLLEMDTTATGGEADPHVWLSPPLYARLVDVIAGLLEEALPASRAGIVERSTAFQRELVELDDRFTDGLATCERDLFVTTHAAFGYLAAEYGLTQQAISGISPEAEPTPDRLAELKGLVEREGVTTIFTEELVSPEVAETLAAEAGVRTDVLRTIEGLTPAERDAGADYISLMLENLAALEEALGCS